MAKESVLKNHDEKLFNDLTLPLLEEDLTQDVITTQLALIVDKYKELLDLAKGLETSNGKLDEDNAKLKEANMSLYLQVTKNSTNDNSNNSSDNNNASDNNIDKKYDFKDLLDKNGDFK